MKLYQIVLSLISVALVGYAVGRYVQPNKVVKEVKEVEVEKVRTEYRTIVKTVSKPDGTKEVTETTENISVNENLNLTESKTTIDNLKPQWKVGALVGKTSIESSLTYGLQVERRILGPFFVGVLGTTNEQKDSLVGLSVSMEF